MTATPRPTARLTRPAECGHDNGLVVARSIGWKCESVAGPNGRSEAKENREVRVVSRPDGHLSPSIAFGICRRGHREYGGTAKDDQRRARCVYASGRGSATCDCGTASDKQSIWRTAGSDVLGAEDGLALRVALAGQERGGAGADAGILQELAAVGCEDQL